jgi:sporulation integral membrane protein YtvI
MHKKERERERVDTPQISCRRAFLINAAYIAFWAGLTAAAIWFLKAYLLPLVAALLLAAALQRPRRWLEKRLWGGSKAAAGILVGLLLLLLAAAIGLLLWRLAAFVGQHTASEWAALMENAWERVAQGIEKMAGGWADGAVGERWQALWETCKTRVSQAIADGIGTALGGILPRFLSRLPFHLFGAVVFVAATTLLTVEYDRAWGFFLRQLAPTRQKTVQAARRLCSAAVQRLARAYALLTLITFLETALGLWLLQADGAIWWAAVTALVDMLPVFGAGTVLVPWALISFLSGDMAQGGGLLALWGVLTVLRRLWEPRVVGKEMDLHPLVTLAAMLLGFRLGGFWGLMLGPLVATLLVELHRHHYIRLWK